MRPEQDIQIAVVAHLRSRSERGVFWFHVPNGGKRSFYLGKIMKDMGVVSGVPDLIVIYRSQVYCLELKSAKGRVRPSQHLVHAAMREAGAKTAIAKSIEEALITLECWGILKRDSSHRVPELQKGNAERA